MYRGVLANRNFLKLWGAQLSSQIAAQLLNYALLIRIYDIASKSSNLANSAVSLLIVAIGLPAILLAVPAGAYVDHRDRKMVLFWTNLIRAILVPLFIIVDTQILAVYIIVFVISIASQFFVPAEGAALPKLVRKDQLVAANSLFIFTLNASFIVGYSMAGPIISRFGIHSVYLVVTVAFMLATLLTSLLPKIPAVVQGRFQLGAILRSIRGDLKRHFFEIIGTKTLLFPILLISLAQTIVGIVAALAPAMSKELFAVGLEQSSYWLVIPAGLGLVLGSVAAAELLRRRNKVKVIYSALFAAAGLMSMLPLLRLLGGQGSLRPITALGTFTLGLLDALILVSAQTLLQYASTDRLRGQIFGTLNMMINIAALLPVFAAGLLADRFDALPVLGGLGVMLALVGFVLLSQFHGISRQYS